MTIQEKSLELHKSLRGKIALHPKVSITDRESLSLAYTPGVGAVSMAIAENPALVWEYTSRRNWVAVVTDGTAVLGFGDIGPEAALPVMEGKAVLFKEFADVDAFPICLRTKNPDEIVAIVKALAPSFGGINLEDISAPRCFDIEERLKTELDIPVFHDDQHGTAIVVLAGLLNAARVAGKELKDLHIVINGAGAAGTAVARILVKVGIADIVVVDRTGILSVEREEMNDAKCALAAITNPAHLNGSLDDALVSRDVFIGVSAPGVLTKERIQKMAGDPIIFALANPTPEITPDEARAAGVRLIATGRSDYPNQVNNVLAFPGVFRGALDGGISHITDDMKIQAAYAIAASCPEPTVDNFIPSVLDRSIAARVARAIMGEK